MDVSTNSLIEALHRAPGRCVLAVTGGGAGAAAMLLAVPGASRTVLEVVVPYDERALTELLGRRPEQACSPETALDLAERAFSRARWLAPLEPVVGIGCTATLATDRAKRGAHRLHVAARGRDVAVYSLTLEKGRRDRAGEEQVVDLVMLNALAEALGVDERVPIPLLPGEALEMQTVGHGAPLRAFLNGRLAAVRVEVDGQITAHQLAPTVLVPGAFNPLHEAHVGLAALASKYGSGDAAFELSVTNVDKPPLAPEEILVRVRQFAWKAPLWLTRAPTFLEKTALFPGAIFVVGVDTALRLVDPRYHGNSEVAMKEALAAIRARRSRFIVAGRSSVSGPFLELEDVPVPEGFLNLFEAIPEERFRVDISSTHLRGETRRSDIPV